MNDNVSTIRIQNTTSERQMLDGIKVRSGFAEDELHLFCWYIGFRMAADEFLSHTFSGSPAEAEGRTFVERNKQSH